MHYYSNVDSIFINERLKKRLDEIIFHPITTIIAPVGYGKTTAMNWWSKRQKRKHPNTIIFRQNILTDSMDDFWLSLCKTLGDYPVLVEQMVGLGYPKDTMSRSIFAEILEEALDESIKTIYFILDDVHLMEEKDLLSLLVFILSAIPEKIHIILLSRNQIFDGQGKMELGSLLCELGIEDLRLKENELDDYAKFLGLNASLEEIKELAISSEGWLSLVYLNFKSYIKDGKWLASSEDIFSLIKQVLLDPLPVKIEEFLILLSTTDEFTKDQAEYLWQDSDAGEILESLTKNNAFLSKNINGIYRYHHMLQECTRLKFYEKPESYKKMIYSRLGYWYLSIEEYINAYNSFYKAGDWDGVLITLEKDRFNNFNKAYSENLSKWLNECPEEIILKYPSAITSSMAKMYVSKNIKQLKVMKKLLLKALDQNTSLRQDEKNNLLGDAEVFESFLYFNDITAMVVCYQRAKSLLSRKTLSIDQRKAMWTFSSPSIFMLYHRSEGGAKEESEKMKESMPYYYDITDGHGYGAEYSFQAELFYEQGKFIDADISNRIALMNAKSKEQNSVELCSKILSMRMAVFNGRWDVIENCNTTCRKALINKKEFALVKTLDISLAYIYSLLDHPEAAAKWILDGDLSEENIMYPAIPIFYTYYNHILLAKKDWIEVVARKDKCKEINGINNNILCQIWLHIHQSAALEKINKHEEALKELREGLQMAVPDDIVMPFVESQIYISSLLKEIRGSGIYIEIIDHILLLSEKFNKGKEKILWGHWNEHEKYGLSKREFFIAKLAAQRKTNIEIAEELHLAPGTVRNQLTCIFDKLSIVGSAKNKRIKLEELLKKEEDFY